MSYEITCPYCFGEKFKDHEVHFRSERVTSGECDIIPPEYDDIEDFKARYSGSGKEQIINQYYAWSFFGEQKDEKYEKHWAQFGGTTEVDPADEFLKVKAYHRKVIDPQNTAHQSFLKTQKDGSYYIRDYDGMVSQIELMTGEKCNRRVCPHCHNPLPANYGKNHVKFVTVIGITGSGKTVYLSQLLKGMTEYAQKVGLSAMVSTPSARLFLDNNTIKANHPVPAGTPKERFQQPLFYELSRSGEGSQIITDTFVLYDVAGELFDNATLIPRFAPFIENADGIILLVDPMQFGVVADVVSGEEQKEAAMTALNAIHNIVVHGKMSEQCHIPLAICMSKSDSTPVQQVLSPELTNLLRNAVDGERAMNGFYKPVFNAKAYNPVAKGLFDFFQLRTGDNMASDIHIKYSSYGYFAFTAMGCGVEEGVTDNGQPYQYPVGPILPKRIEEPILWLFHQFGYIGTNERPFKPGSYLPLCPNCRKHDAVEKLVGEERLEVVGKWPFRKTYEYDYICKTCGYKWVDAEAEE